MRVLGNGAQRIGVNIKAGAVGEMKHPNEIDRVTRKAVFDFHLQPTRPNGEAINLFLPPKQGRQARRSTRLFLRRFQRGTKNGCQIADIFGHQKITPHEFLNRLHRRRIFGFLSRIEKLSQGFLQIKAQTLLRHIGQKMQMAAHMPKKIIAFSKQLQLICRQHTKPDQIIQRLDLIAVSGNPKQRIQVAQSAFALFQIRLHQIARATGFFMPLIALRQLGGHKLARRTAHDFCLKSLAIAVINRAAAP